MSFQTRLLFTVVILINLSATATAQNYRCSGGNYTSNSTYAANLNSVISSLPQNINDNGFHNTTAGQAPDRAYATALCRADFQLDLCRSCIREAADQLLQSYCPNKRQGIRYKRICTVRYSNEPLSGGAGAESNTIARGSRQTLRSPEQFNQKLRALLRGLRQQAAGGGPFMKMAVGNATAPDFQTAFALVQCTPDLSERDCTNCLISSEQYICCRNITWVYVYKAGCHLRYDVEPFYNSSRLEEVRAMISPPVSEPAPPLPSSRDEEEDVSAEESLLYNFKELADATDNFSNSNKLGQGGFGAVYKGKLQSGQQIAVKRLSRNSGQGEIEFKNEVVLMAKLQHRNFVRLLGFSLQGSERLLVYEFIYNGSLDCFIFDPVKRLLIDWECRYKIIKSIAKGLVYLHEDSPQRIIHRDLKASNILLDADNNPKISDFGMARLFEHDETRGNTRRIVGTYFGVLLLEIISGQSNSSFKNVENGENVEYMLSFAWRNWCTGRGKRMIDPTLMSSSSSLRDMLKCIHIALMCVQQNASDRPTMASVVVMLHSFSVTFPVPSQPAYFVPHGVEEMSRSLAIKSSETTKYETSLTELYPR